MMKKMIILNLLLVVFLIYGCSKSKTVATYPEYPLPVYEWYCGVNSFIDTNGDLYTWGMDHRNSYSFYNMDISENDTFWRYSLGQGENVTINNQPTKVLESVTKVIWGKYIVTEDQRLFELGTLRNGETYFSPQVVGDGVTYDILYYIDQFGGLHAVPEKVLYNSELSLSENSVLIMESVTDTVLNSKEWIALKQDGTVWSFQFDFSEMTITGAPKKILKNVLKLIKDESGANFNVGFLTNTGDLYIMGDNEFGICGNGKTGDRDYLSFGDLYISKPNKVLENVTNAWIYKYAAYAVTKDGVLYGWGLNDHDLMLTGEPVSTRNNGIATSYRTSPVKIMEGVRDFVPGYSTAFAIKSDNTLWAWGAREGGMLGVGDYFEDYDKNTFSTITQIVNLNATYEPPKKILDDVKRVFKCGFGPVFAQKSNGSVWYWGRDSVAVEESENWDTNNYNYFQKYYIIPEPIEFNIETYYQTALNFIATRKQN